MPQEASSAFAEWWARILQRDAAYMRAWQADRDDGSGLPGANPLLGCVFCGRDLAEKIRRDASGTFCGGDMLAYWVARMPLGKLQPVIAAGLYCRSKHGCLSWAERTGLLFDDHAPNACGRNAWPHLQRRLFDIPLWEPPALRRFVLVHAELAKLPTLTGSASVE